METTALNEAAVAARYDLAERRSLLPKAAAEYRQSRTLLYKGVLSAKKWLSSCWAQNRFWLQVALTRYPSTAMVVQLQSRTMYAMRTWNTVTPITCGQRGRGGKLQYSGHQRLSFIERATLPLGMIASA